VTCARWRSRRGGGEHEGVSPRYEKILIVFGVILGIFRSQIC
jgi:hypothetical protein